MAPSRLWPYGSDCSLPPNAAASITALLRPPAAEAADARSLRLTCRDARGSIDAHLAVMAVPALEIAYLVAALPRLPALSTLSVTGGGDPEGAPTPQAPHLIPPPCAPTSCASYNALALAAALPALTRLTSLALTGFEDGVGGRAAAALFSNLQLLSRLEDLDLGGFELRPAEWHGGADAARAAVTRLPRLRRLRLGVRLGEDGGDALAVHLASGGWLQLQVGGRAARCGLRQQSVETV